VSDARHREAAILELGGIYLHELWWLLSTIIDELTAVLDSLAVTGNHYIAVDPLNHGRIFVAINAAARAQKLIGFGGRTKPRPGLSLFAEFVRDGLVTEMFNNSVRNSIEHFDEDLERLVKRIRTGRVREPAAVYNMTLSSRSVFSHDVVFVRVLVADERRFYAFASSIDLGKLRAEAVLLRDALTASGKLGQMSEPGGLIVPIHQP
jgi:hypothetical protein